MLADWRTDTIEMRAKAQNMVVDSAAHTPNTVTKVSN